MEKSFTEYLRSQKKIPKLIVIFIVLFLVYNFIRCVTSNYVFDAAVNEQNGVVSILTRDYEIETYDKHGNLIYSTKLINSTGGYAFLEYVDGQLQIKALRTNKLYVLDEHGEIVQQDVYDPKEPGKAWDSWQRDSLSYSFTTDGIIYRYNKPDYWRYLLYQRNFSFEIIDVESQKAVTIWTLSD